MRPLLLLLPLVVLLPACAAPATIGSRTPPVRISADESADFARYRTYAFVPGQLSADRSAVRVSGEELDRRVRAALAPRLAAKGLQPATDDAKPDLHVTYTATLRRDAAAARAGGRGRDVGGYDEPGVIPPGGEWGARESSDGRLALQFSDAESRVTVWQAAVAVQTLDEPRDLDRALDAALENYPPKR